MQYLSKVLFLFIACTSANLSAEQDFFGLWETQGSGTFTFRPLDANNIAMITIFGDFQDIYVGSFNGSSLSVCTADSEPFTACYSGTIKSNSSIALVLDSCENKGFGICSSLRSEELTRTIHHDISGIFLVISSDNYYMIEDSGGLFTAHQLYLENGEVSSFSGSRTGNIGSVKPTSGCGAALDFEIFSSDEFSATITSRTLCEGDDSQDKDPTGTVFPLRRVTN